MKAYITVEKQKIKFAHALECGQIFSFKKTDFGFCVYSSNKIAIIVEKESHYLLFSDDLQYFWNFFDLGTDYEEIKHYLKTSSIYAKKCKGIVNVGEKPLKTFQEFLNEAVDFGEGIRIIKQDLFEVLVSFCVSANNNIKRITASLFEFRKKFGKFVCISEILQESVLGELVDFYAQKGEYQPLERAFAELALGGVVNTEGGKNASELGFYAFPEFCVARRLTEEDYRGLGVGYRAPQLVLLMKQLEDACADGETVSETLNRVGKQDTARLRRWLMELSGVGGKVADCVLLFGYARGDVFPVDTWIAKVFERFFGEGFSRVQMREILVSIFGNLSGVAQQYVFFLIREKSSDYV